MEVYYLCWMKIDIHAHILPENWPNLKDRYGYGGFIQMNHIQPGTANMVKDNGTFFRRIESNCWSPEAILKDMEIHHVDAMVLCTVPVLFNYWAKPHDTLDWSMFLNDHLASVCEKNLGKFYGLGTLPMQNIPLAIQEMERCKHIGLKGIEIGSHIEDKNLDHPDFHPFWEAASSLGMPIFVHPWDMMGQEKMKDYFLPWLVGMPAETTLAICSMIFGGIFDKFPDLKVMFAHAGGSFPFTLGRISHGWHCRPDLCDIHYIQDPKSYIGKFWVDGITHDEAALEYLIQLLGADKIAYGTDYPFPLGDLEHGKMIESSEKFNSEIKRKIMSQTAQTFLNI